MIEELTKYISLIQKEHPLESFDKSLPDGLHIAVRVNGSEVKVEKAILTREGKTVLSPQDEEYILKEILPREMHTSYIESNKAIADKKIHSASPYSIKFKRQILPEEKDKYLSKSEKEKKSKWLNEWPNHVKTYCFRHLSNAVKPLS